MSSDYMKSAVEAKGKLNKVSSSMCLAKWMQTSLHLTTGKTNSCYHPPLHSINKEQIAVDPAKLHNTDEKKQQRDLMLQGKRPDGILLVLTALHNILLHGHKKYKILVLIQQLNHIMIPHILLALIKFYHKNKILMLKHFGNGGLIFIPN